jgi:hypothetical protein
VFGVKDPAPDLLERHRVVRVKSDVDLFVELTKSIHNCAGILVLNTRVWSRDDYEELVINWIDSLEPVRAHLDERRFGRFVLDVVWIRPVEKVKLDVHGHRRVLPHLETGRTLREVQLLRAIQSSLHQRK